MLSALTRKEFDEACAAYIQKCRTEDPTFLKTYPSDWTWHEHPTFAGLGYMSREIVTLFRPKSADQEDQEDPSFAVDVDEEDLATVSSEVSEIIKGHLYVVYSATFRVPALYFALHHQNGGPLSLEEILRLTPVRAHVLAGSKSTFALELPGASFPALSQVVGEILAEKGEDDGGLVGWIETWFMVMGNVIDFCPVPR